MKRTAPKSWAKYTTCTWRAAHNFLAKISQKNVSPFYFASPKIIMVKICHRQTDGQTDKFFDTIYWCVWVFSSRTICFLPTRFACRGINKPKEKATHLFYLRKYKSKQGGTINVRLDFKFFSLLNVRDEGSFMGIFRDLISKVNFWKKF